MAISALPTPPSTNDPATFDARADAFLGALPAFAVQAEAMRVEVSGNAAQVATDRTAADASAAMASALASFHGDWSGLSGAAAPPYSVRHNNRFWMLASPIASIAAKTPGVASEWIDAVIGVILTGDAGTGGAKGLVPAPAAGDAAAGKYLKADGTWAILPASGLNLLATLTASNSASLQDTVSLTSAYDAYAILFDGVLPASSSQFVVESTANSGSTWFEVGRVTNTGGAAITLPATGTGICGFVPLSNPNQTLSPKIMNGWAGVDGAPYILCAYSTAQGNTAINGLRFKFASANITRGKIRIYGIKT